MRRRDGNQRDPAIERLWFRVALITVDDLGKPFPPGRGPMAAVFHHGEPVAYYSSYNGTPDAALSAARESVPLRVDALCGVVR